MPTSHQTLQLSKTDTFSSQPKKDFTAISRSVGRFRHRRQTTAVSGMKKLCDRTHPKSDGLLFAT